MLCVCMLGFIKGRYIGENVRLISKVIENANKRMNPD